MKKFKKQEISFTRSDEHLRDNFFSKEDAIEPVLAYFIFTAKYIMKKKSTIISPILSFIVVLIISLIPLFVLKTNNPEGQKEAFLQIFLPIISLFLISLSSIFSTTKALNLFKDISNEGMEILIVSKPIKRSQIIFVRFSFFLLLGIIFSLTNYFALLIGLFISRENLPQSFEIFNFITISFFSLLMSYILFGSISIMLSLKFSTKLVSGFSTVILSIGVVLTQVVPVVVPIIEKDFFDKIQEHNSTVGYDNVLELKYYITTKGKVIIYTDDIQTPLTPEQKAIVKSNWDSSDDFSWILNLNDFLNPIAGIAKISSPNPIFFNDNEFSSSSFYSKINLTDFKVSLIEGTVENNLWGNSNYFVEIDDIFLKNIALNLEVTLEDQVENLHPIKLTGLYKIREILENKISFDEVSKIFDNLLSMNLFENDDMVNRGLIIERTQDLFKSSFLEIISILNDVANDSISIELINNDSNAIGIKSFNEKDLTDQLILFFFYIYGLERMNGNIEEFNNKVTFLNSSFNLGANKFLGNNFSIIEYSGKRSPILYDLPAAATYETFLNRGEKVNSIAVGFSWSLIILVILMGTVFVYYRKDFS